jgi:hypothetical protein
VARIWTCDTTKPFMFKSFKATALTDGTSDASAEHLLVSGTNLIVAGNEALAKVKVAKVWRHDAAAPFGDQSFASASLTAAPTILPGAYDGAAYGMATDGSTLYVSGYAGDGTNDLATLWTYNLGQTFAQDAFAATSLQPGADAYGNDVKVSNGTVWVAGSTSPAVNPVAMVWSQSLDGLATGTAFVATALNVGAFGAEAFALSENAGTLYIAGYEANDTVRVAKYWSAPLTDLTFKATVVANSSYDSEVADLAVVGGVVYAAGYDAQPLVAPPPPRPRTPRRCSGRTASPPPSRTAPPTPRPTASSSRPTDPIRVKPPAGAAPPPPPVY